MRQALKLGRLALFACGLMMSGTFSYAQTEPVNLAWDANTEATVAGYIVYVGNAPGSYGERYDVGEQTSFVYTHVSAGKPYYFAVAAYTEDREVGPLSDPIFFLTGAARVAPPASTGQVASAELLAHRQVGCTASPDPDCSGIDQLVGLMGNASAPTPIGDGRLFFIENGTHVRVLSGDSLIPEAALTTDPGSRLTGLVLDPHFERTRFVYATEVQADPDGRRRLDIVRYREVANVLGERATIVTGIPLPDDGEAPLAIDGAGRLYLAVPDTADGTASVYDGMVLRFEADGSVSRDSRGSSPVFAYGFEQPVSLVWSDVRNELWLAGSHGNGDGVLGRLPLDGSTTTWPRMPAVTSVVQSNASIVSLSTGRNLMRGSSASDDKASELVAIDEDGTMLRIDGRNPAVPGREYLPAWVDEQPTSAGLDALHLYVVFTSSGGDTSRIIRLTRSSN